MTRSLPAVLALLILAACGFVATANAASASSVSVQPGDLPGGMHRCDQSGDMNTYLKNLKTKDPAAYTTTKSKWDDAKKNGATAAQVEFYSDDVANCANVSNVTSLANKLVVNFVIQFKNEASAAAGYTSGSIFGIDKSTLQGAGAPVVEGTKTGLGGNSIVLNSTIANQTFYIAVWQHKAFMVILGLINVDTVSGQKVADAENKRIH
jgi:hypothetical protein